MENDSNKIEHDDIDMNEVNATEYGKTEISKEPTEIEKAVYLTPAFLSLLNALGKIDFRAIKFPKKMTKLYAELKEAMKTYKAELLTEVWERINALKVSFEEQIVILSKELLEISKKQNCRIAFMNDVFYVYDLTAGYWKKIDKAIIQEFFSEAAIKAGIPEITAKQSKKKARLLEQLMSDGMIVRVNDKKSINRVLVNLKNGTYCIEGSLGKLLGHNPDDMLTYVLDFEYDADATAPKFQKFLDEVLPDKNTQKVMLEYIGYCLTNGLHMEKMLILYGSGANGKSTLENIIVRMVGESNVCSFTLAEICDEKGYYREPLADKMINIVTEMGSGRINFDIVKSIISQESISARQPFGKAFNFIPKAKLILSTNTLPHGEPTHGWKRRLLLAVLGVTIPVEKQNRNLVDEICKDELPGIFNLALKGIERLIAQNQFSYSKEMEQALERYTNDSDNVRLFLEDENWVTSTTEKIPLSELNGYYREYCKISGYSPCARNKFGNRLRDAGFRVVRSDNGYTFVYCEKVLFVDDAPIDLDSPEDALDKMFKNNHLIN